MYLKLIEQFWHEIAEFEVGEVKAWIGTNPVLTEARTCERVKAYNRLFDLKLTEMGF